MSLFFFDLDLLRSCGAVSVVVISALFVASLTRRPTPPDIPTPGDTRAETYGSTSRRLDVAPLVFVETRARVEAWLSAPHPCQPPWTTGPVDHVWARRDVEAWKRDAKKRVLASLPTAEGRLHLDLGGCGAIAITADATAPAGVDEEMVASLRERTDIHVDDQRLVERADDSQRPDQYGPGTTWFALQPARLDAPAIVIVSAQPVAGYALRVDVGRYLQVPSVGLTLELDEPTPVYGDDVQLRADRSTVEVQVLGDISVVGASLRPKPTALLAYLALHPGAPAPCIEEAIWPGCTGSARKRLHVTASQIRAATGDDVLPPAVDNRYRTGAAVSTDLASFEAHVDRPSDSAEERAKNLVTALELVRGPVCGYGDDMADSYRWVDLEYWVATVEATVTRTAFELADLARESGDLGRAAWALRQGLVAAPLDAALVEALLAVLAETGDAPAVDDVYESHVQRLEAAELGPPAEGTVQAYREAIDRCADTVVR